MGMVDAFTIGMKINVQGDANEKISAFGKIVAEANQKVNLLNRSVKKLNESLSKTSNVLGVVMPKLAEFAGTFTDSMKTANTELASFNTKLKETAVLSSGGRGRGGSGGGGIGIGGILSYFGGAQFAAMLGGGFLLKDSFQANSHFETSYAQFAAQGYGTQADAQARALAENTNIAGVTKTQLMTAIGEASTITRNASQAFELAPSLSKMRFANQAIFSREGKDFTDTDEMNLLRSAELFSGSTKSSKVLAKLNLIQKGISSEAGNLRSEDILSFGKRAASILPSLSDDAWYRFIPIIQALGGSTTGFGARLFQSSLLRGQVFGTGKRATARLEHLGVLHKGKVENADLLTSDPIKWAETVLFKKFAAGGVTSDLQVAQEIKKDFSGTTAALLQQIWEMRSKIEQTVQMSHQSQGIQGGYIQALNMPAGKIVQLSASWTNLMTSIGKLSSSPVIRGLNALIYFIDGITRMADVINHIASGDVKSQVPKIVHFSQRRATSAIDHFLPGFSELIQGMTKQSSSATIVINLDGKKVGDGVMKSAANGFHLAPSSGASITPQLNFMPTSFNYSG